MCDPKYQYSKFLGDNREEQVVIRCDTWAEFIEAKANIDGLLAGKVEDVPHPAVISYQEHQIIQAPNKQGVPTPVTEFDKICQRCGGEKILNPKTGKMFCKAKCWLQSP